MGRVAGAVAEFDRLLTAQQRVLGADHPDTLTTRNNLAFCRGEGGMSPMICLFEDARLSMNSPAFRLAVENDSTCEAFHALVQ